MADVNKEQAQEAAEILSEHGGCVVITDDDETQRSQQNKSRL